MEGRRVQKTPDQGEKGLAIAGAVAAAAMVAVLGAAYVGLSAWVSTSGVILPNVSVAGVDVSNMTAAQAEQAVRRQAGDIRWTGSVELECGEHTGILDGSCFQVDAAACVQEALHAGRELPVANGVRYLSGLLGSARDLPVSHVELTAQGEEALESHLRQAERADYVNEDANRYTLDLEAGTMAMAKGVTHYAVDRTAARTAVAEAFAQVLDGGTAKVRLESTQQPPQTPDFAAIHSQVYTEVKNAEMDPETYAITEHTVGVDFNLNAAQAAFDRAGEGEAFLVPLIVTQPRDTRESLESKLFADLLGEATTTVTGDANRKINVQLSGEACNGIILLPGEEFSYNTATGSRSADKGYLPAPVYVGGRSEDGVGGGICQTSSTIYYAVLHTTLEITERHNHQFTVTYMPKGMDATVYFGSLDFRFRNSTDYPLKIVTESYDEKGARKLTVKLYGTNADGRYAVPESTAYDQVLPDTVYKARDDVPRGTLVLDREQYAYTGWKARTYRTVYEADGTLVEKQDLGVSRYKSRPNTYYYNPLDGAPETWPDGKPPAASASATEPDQNPGAGEAGGGQESGVQGGGDQNSETQDTGGQETGEQV